MVFLLVWAILLVVFVMGAIRRGQINKERIKKVNEKVDSVDIKVKKLWQKIK